MKAEYWVNKRLKVEIEGKNAEDLYTEIADIHAIFEDEVCGKCGKENIFPKIRKVDDNVFYEMHCGTCHYRCIYGRSKKDQKLYVKRVKTDSKGKAIKGQDGKMEPLPNKGWGIYSTDQED